MFIMVIVRPIKIDMNMEVGDCICHTVRPYTIAKVIPSNPRRIPQTINLSKIMVFKGICTLPQMISSGSGALVALISSS
jgi:hypothetical protein